MQLKATLLVLLGTALMAVASPIAVTEVDAVNPLFEVRNELGERAVCTSLSSLLWKVQDLYLSGELYLRLVLRVNANGHRS